MDQPNESPNGKTDKSIVPSKGSGDLAVIGEGTPNETSVSFQVLQGIYHELTGKTEEISKSYQTPFKVTLQELQNLDHKLRQCCEQFNVRAGTTQIRVFYINDTQERYSSFEKFRLLNAGSTSCVESVVLKYNFLILLPKTHQPQSYTISVRIASRIAIDKKMSSEMYDLPKIIRLMGSRTAVVTIEYVDYMVARTLLELIDGWAECLPRSPESVVFRYIRKHSHLLPFISRYIVGAFVAYLVLAAIPLIITPDASLATVTTFSFTSLFGLFAAYRAAHHFGSAAEDAVDDWSSISYVQLTAADKQLICQSEAKNKWALVKACLELVGSVFVVMLAHVVSNYLIS